MKKILKALIAILKELRALHKTVRTLIELYEMGKPTHNDHALDSMRYVSHCVGKEKQTIADAEKVAEQERFNAMNSQKQKPIIAQETTNLTVILSESDFEHSFINLIEQEVNSAFAIPINPVDSFIPIGYTVQNSAMHDRVDNLNMVIFEIELNADDGRQFKIAPFVKEERIEYFTIKFFDEKRGEWEEQQE